MVLRKAEKLGVETIDRKISDKSVVPVLIRPPIRSINKITQWETSKFVSITWHN